MSLQRNDLRYDYAGDRRLLEGADWFGERSMGLQAHFHREVQVSIIWEGRRDYLVGSERVTLRPCQVLILGHSVPHKALPTRNASLRSAEFYFDPTIISPTVNLQLKDVRYLVIDSPELIELTAEGFGKPRFELAAKIADQFTVSGASSLPASHRLHNLTPMEDAVMSSDDVSQAARRLGYTAEGFIRAFARVIGLTPHAYKVNHRLNEGRQLLREGVQIAEAANLVGFSDQSHFGRAFLRHFGATPGHFQTAHRCR